MAPEVESIYSEQNYAMHFTLTTDMAKDIWLLLVLKKNFRLSPIVKFHIFLLYWHHFLPKSFT